MKFTDYCGRDWSLALSIGRLRLVKAELQIDLLNLHKSPETMERLSEDPVFLVDAISVLLTNEIKDKGLDADSFAAGLVNDKGECQPVTDAANALLEAIFAFSPPEKARALKQMWMRGQTLTQTTLSHMATKVEANYQRIEQAAIQKTDEEFDRVLLATFGISSGSGAESSD